MKVLGHAGHAAAHPWPDEAQTLLLAAALGEPGAARAAWERWYRDTEIDTLDYDAHRMFPLLYRHLVALGIDCPDLPRLKGVYRHYWYSNQLLLRDARTALQALHAASIETLMLKGLALTALHYRDGGTRPMYDIDLLVHRSDASRAVRVLCNAGYMPVSDRPLEIEMRTSHAIGLRSAEGRELDLHWYAFSHWSVDEDLWTASVPLTVTGVPTRALCPADQLMHACVHGMSAASPAPMRWVADAVTVIQTSGDQLDWRRFVDRAIARQSTVTLLDALTHVGRLVAVPRAVTDALRAAPASRAERLAHRVAIQGYAPGSFYAVEWDRYRRLRAARTPGLQRNFAAYLVERQHLDGYLQLIGELGRGAARFFRQSQWDRRHRIPA